jgi:hypothetical protein
MLETQHSYEIARKCEQWRRTVGHGAFDASECPCERAVTHGEQVRGPQKRVSRPDSVRESASVLAVHARPEADDLGVEIRVRHARFSRDFSR